MGRNEFAALMKKHREAQELSLRELARRADIDAGLAWQLEAGRCGPSPETAARISQGLGLPEDELALAAGLVPVYVAEAYRTDTPALRRAALRILRKAGR